jgi:hypothetical protein
MIDPWRFVDADDDLVSDLLAGSIEAVLDLGGWIHPAARFVGEAGQLSVQCPAEDGEPLIRLPREAFVRIGRVGWTADRDSLAFEAMPDEFPGPERELLILQIALHNACAKIPWLARTHPVLATDLTPGVIAAVRAFRPSFRLRQPSPASLFWSNRAFRLPATDSGPAEPLALPLVDLLNHDHRGATGTWTGTGFEVAVARVPGSDECLLDYGFERDAIGMAVVYGFADRTASVAHSAPLAVDVPGVGHVRVLARGRTRTAELLPPVAARDGDGTTISHLTYRPGGRAALVGSVVTATGWPEAACADVVRSVAAANTDLAERLIASAHGGPTSAAGSILREAAERQRGVLSAGLSDGPSTESSSSSLSSGMPGGS